MAYANQLLVFSLADRRHGLYLTAVDRVIHAVDITPLPKAPDIILGMINLQGQVLPVINMRRRLGLPEREIVLTDQFIIAHASRRALALVTDGIREVIECPPLSRIAMENIFPDITYTAEAVKQNDGLMLIQNLEQFLSLEEEHSLDRALERR